MKKSQQKKVEKEVQELIKQKDKKEDLTESEYFKNKKIKQNNAPMLSISIRNKIDKLLIPLGEITREFVELFESFGTISNTESSRLIRNYLHNIDLELNDIERTIKTWDDISKHRVKEYFERNISDYVLSAEEFRNFMKYQQKELLPKYLTSTRTSRLPPKKTFAQSLDLKNTEKLAEWLEAQAKVGEEFALEQLRKKHPKEYKKRMERMKELKQGGAGMKKR